MMFQARLGIWDLASNKQNKEDKKEGGEGKMESIEVMFIPWFLTGSPL